MYMLFIETTRGDGTLCKMCWTAQNKKAARNKITELSNAGMIFNWRLHDGTGTCEGSGLMSNWAEGSVWEGFAY